MHTETRYRIPDDINIIGGSKVTNESSPGSGKPARRKATVLLRRGSSAFKFGSLLCGSGVATCSRSGGAIVCFRAPEELCGKMLMHWELFSGWDTCFIEIRLAPWEFKYGRWGRVSDTFGKQISFECYFDMFLCRWETLKWFLIFRDLNIQWFFCGTEVTATRSFWLSNWYLTMT